MNSKPIILYDNVFTRNTPTATNTAEGYDVLNIRDLKEYTYWKPSSTAAIKYLTVDLNLFDNCGFEDGDWTGWTQNDATLASSGPPSSHSGIYAALLSPSGSDLNGPASDKISIDITKDYQFSMYHRLDNRVSGGFVAQLNFYDSEGTYITASNVLFTTTDTGIGYTNTTTTVGPNSLISFPDGAAMVSFSCYTAGTADLDVWIDDIIFYEKITVDSLAMASHNLWSFAGVGASLDIQYTTSDTGYTTGWSWSTSKYGYQVDNDKTFMTQFTGQEARAWRVGVYSSKQLPYIGVCILGPSFTMEQYPQNSFDPDSEEIMSQSSTSLGGQIIGTIINYHKREINARFTNITPSWFEDTFRPAWNNHLKLLKPFFFAWDITNHSDEVYFVRLKDKFTLTAPYSKLYRNLNLDMIGVAE